MAEGKDVNDSQGGWRDIREQTRAAGIPAAVQAGGFDRYTGKRKGK